MSNQFAPYGGDRDVECKRCGKAGLHWDDDGDGNWLLLTSHDEIHKCDEARVRRAMASEFEPIK